MIETTLIKALTEVIQQVGFPAAVALWLLWRTDKRLEKMADVIGQVAVTLAAIEKALEGVGTGE